VIDSAKFSVRCVSRDMATLEFGAAGNAEAMAIRERFAKADGHASTKQSATNAKPNDRKTLRDSKPFGEESNVTENPLESFRKQRTCRGQNRLSRTTPLLRIFRSGKRPFAKARAQTVNGWRRQPNSEQCQRFHQRLRCACSHRKKRQSFSAFLKAHLLGGARKGVALRS
jgi:hypothetical protein